MKAVQERGGRKCTGRSGEGRGEGKVTFIFVICGACRGAAARISRADSLWNARPLPFLSREAALGWRRPAGRVGERCQPPLPLPPPPTTPPRPRARAPGFPTPRADNLRSFPAFSVTGTSTCARPSHYQPRACRRSARTPGRVRAHRPHPLNRYWSARPGSEGWTLIGQFLSGVVPGRSNFPPSAVAQPPGLCPRASGI